MLTKSPRWHLQEFTQNPIEYLNFRGPIALKVIIGLPLSILFLSFCLATRRKIAMIPSAAFGHALLEPELLQGELEAGLHKELKAEKLIWLFDAKIPNSHLMRVHITHLSGLVAHGRFVDAIKSVLLRIFDIPVGKWLNSQLVITPKSGVGVYPHLDTLDLLHSAKSRIKKKFQVDFNADLLLTLGIPSDARIVCFSIRDASWYKRFYGRSYLHLEAAHSQRNLSPEAFWPALSFLLDEGFFVIRMGRSEQRYFAQHPQFIDYAFSKFTNAKLDFFLYQRAELIISSDTGDSALGYLLQKPHVLVHWTYLNMMNPLVFNRRYLPALPFDKDSGKPLSLYDTLKRGFDTIASTSSLERVGIRFGAPRSKEIEDACRDAIAGINQRNASKYFENLQSQEDFWNWYRHIQVPAFRGPQRSLIDPIFFKNNPEFFDTRSRP